MAGVVSGTKKIAVFLNILCSMKGLAGFVVCHTLKGKHRFIWEIVESFCNSINHFLDCVPSRTATQSFLRHPPTFSLFLPSFALIYFLFYPLFSFSLFFYYLFPHPLPPLLLSYLSSLFSSFDIIFFPYFFHTLNGENVNHYKPADRFYVPQGLLKTKTLTLNCP